jgi:hypothetical protein
LSGTEYLEGAAFFVVMLGATGAAAHFGLGWRRDLRGMPRALAFATLWLAAIVTVHVLPGALGILGRVEVGVTSVLLLAAVYAAARVWAPTEASGEAVELFPPAPESGIRSWVFAAGSGAAVGGLLLSLILRDADSAPWHVDLVSFHLPNVARWIQTGSLWHISDFIPDRSPGNYPETGDIFSLSVILPWRADFLVRLVNCPLLVLTGLSCYALSRELRAPAATSAIVAAGVIALPVVGWVAFASLADTSMLATFGMGVYFLVRSARSGLRADLVFAGIALGLSLGTRWYAVYAVAAVLGVWALAWLIAKRPFREVAGGFGLLTGLALLFGGFWLLRNLVESGNPVYPVKIAPLGITLFDAPADLYREREGFTIAHYATDFDVWRKYLWPGFLLAMGWISIALWAGLAGGAGLAFARLRRHVGDRRDSAIIIALVAAAAIISLAFVVTPYTAVGPEGRPEFGFVNSRYVIPALVLGAGVLAWLVTQAGQWRQLLELAIVVVTLDGVRRIADLPGPNIDARGLAVAFVVGALLLAVIVGGVLLLRSGRRLVFAAAAAGLVLVAVLVGRAQERDFERDRYANVNPVFQYIRDQAPAGARVGLVGEGWGNYPLFGPRLRNDVEYIGHRRRGTMRPWRTRREFDRALAEHRYDIVAVQELYSLDENLPLEQERWLKGRGYKLIAEGIQVYAYQAPLRLYAAPGTRL